MDKSISKNRKVKITGRLKTSVLRHYQNSTLKKHILTLPHIKSVLNVGAVPGDSDKEGNRYIDYFGDLKYYTIDKNRWDVFEQHYNIDLHELTSVHEQFDLILLMNVLEHVENPFIVSTNLQALLKPNGYIFICTPFFYPIHKDQSGKFSDYWRFTDDGIRILFKEMQELWIVEVPGVVEKVKDRAQYWDDPSNIVTGYCALFQKKSLM